MNGPTRLGASTGVPTGDASNTPGRAPLGLFAGDLLTVIAVTLLGFASHQTLGSAGTRILAVFIPMLVGWAAVAPFLGVYDPARVSDLRQLWRPAWAMLLAAPLAAVLRGFWLQAPVLPVFVAVLAGVGIAGILAWRFIYALITRRVG